MPMPRYIIVFSELDPVARGIEEIWGPRPAAEGHVDGAPLRRLNDGVWTLRRPGRHIHDEHLDHRLPPPVRTGRVPLVFPSIHRSEQGPVCFTVHPLGNWGEGAQLGGAPRTVGPTAPRLMSAALRALASGASSVGLTATYEATHHGPELEVPACFAEIGGGADPEHPAPAHLRVLAAALEDLREDPRDRIALGVGGGHYAPHFSELARTRSWAFGHILPRHALAEVTRSTLQQALQVTEAAEGILFSRSMDARLELFDGLAPRLRDSDAAERETWPPG
jgi:D-tyrosyl-tRNA(Tyr) deacylase